MRCPVPSAQSASDEQSHNLHRLRRVRLLLRYTSFLRKHPANSPIDKATLTHRAIGDADRASSCVRCIRRGPQVLLDCLKWCQLCRREPTASWPTTPILTGFSDAMRRVARSRLGVAAAGRGLGVVLEWMHAVAVDGMEAISKRARAIHRPTEREHHLIALSRYGAEKLQRGRARSARIRDAAGFASLRLLQQYPLTSASRHTLGLRYHHHLHPAQHLQTPSLSARSRRTQQTSNTCSLHSLPSTTRRCPSALSRLTAFA